MKILALDLGTTTGWAIKDKYGVISGSQSFKPSRFEGSGMRFLKFRNWLQTVCQDVSLVTFEEVRRHAGVDAAHAYGGFLGHLTAFCEGVGIPYQGVSVGIIKKHATGRGNASKYEMIAAAKAKGHSPDDDNEADALALLDYSVKEWPEVL